MTGQELIACIAFIVFTCLLIATFLGALRECRQKEDDIWNHELKETMLNDMLEKQKNLSRQLEEDMKKLREENARLCKECIVLRHGEQGKEAEDEQKERSEKV